MLAVGYFGASTGARGWSLGLNRQALCQMQAPSRIEIVAGASYLSRSRERSST